MTHSTASLSPEILDALRQRRLEAVLEPARHSDPNALARLARDLRTVDWQMLDRQRTGLQEEAQKPSGELQAPELRPASTSNAQENDAATDCGWEALRKGRVALATVAGGQASRLGFDGPKGAYPLGSVSGASLFQILAGKVKRLRHRSGVVIPWIIQTGPGNHSDTRDFFERRNWFDLGRQSVHLICQGTLPALSPDGDLLLSAPDRLFRNPDGHGGFFGAMYRSGLTAKLRQSGVDTLFYCQVDNPLVRMGDPVFLGHHLLGASQVSVKVVEKTDPSEKVGLVVMRNGRAECLEYSDLPESLTSERSEDGGLRFRAGNIAVHAFHLDFLEELAQADLPLHLARKKVAALAQEPQASEPVPRDGVKFETFVFDCLPMAEWVTVQLADRAQEFAPVKNRDGVDSIRTSREAMDLQARAWCKSALPGLQLATEGWVELQPGLAFDADDLRRRAGDVQLHCNDRLVARIS